MNNFKIKEITIPSLDEVESLGIKELEANDYSNCNGTVRYYVDKSENGYFLRDVSKVYFDDFEQFLPAFNTYGFNYLPYDYGFPFIRIMIFGLN